MKKTKAIVYTVTDCFYTKINLVAIDYRNYSTFQNIQGGRALPVGQFLLPHTLMPLPHNPSPPDRPPQLPYTWPHPPFPNPANVLGWSVLNKCYLFIKQLVISVIHSLSFLSLRVIPVDQSILHSGSPSCPLCIMERITLVGDSYASGFLCPLCFSVQAHKVFVWFVGVWVCIPRLPCHGSWHVAL